MTSLLDKIRVAVTTGGIQKTELAEEAEVHRNSLVDVEKPTWNPRYRTAEALSKAVDRIKERRA